MGEEELEAEERVEQQSNSTRISRVSERVESDPPAVLAESAEPASRTYDEPRTPTIVSKPISISIRDEAFQSLLPLPTNAAINERQPATPHPTISQPASNESVANLGAGASVASSGELTDSTREAGNGGYPTQPVNVRAEGEGTIDTMTCNSAATAAPAVPRVTGNEGESVTFDFTTGINTEWVEIDWGDGTVGDVVLTNGTAGEAHSVGHVYEDDDPSRTPSDDYTITATSKNLCSSTSATFTARISNLAPNAASDSAEVMETGTVSIDVLKNDTDPGDDELEVVRIDTSATTGKVTLAQDGTVTYDTNGQFLHLKTGQTATDSFQYVARDDDTGESAVTNVAVTINGFTQIPKVSLVVLDDHTEERNDGETPDTAQIEVSRTGDTSDALLVLLTWATIHGNQLSGTDNAVLIPSGQSSALLTLDAINDSDIEKDMTIGVYIRENGRPIGAPPNWQPEYTIDYDAYDGEIKVDDNEWRWIKPKYDTGSGVFKEVDHTHRWSDFDTKRRTHISYGFEVDRTLRVDGTSTLGFNYVESEFDGVLAVDVLTAQFSYFVDSDRNFSFSCDKRTGLIGGGATAGRGGDADDYVDGGVEYKYRIDHRTSGILHTVDLEQKFKVVGGGTYVVTPSIGVPLVGGVTLTLASGAENWKLETDVDAPAMQMRCQKGWEPEDGEPYDPS